MIADPHAVAAEWPVARQRMLADLTMLVTEAPWSLSRAHHERAHAAGLSDDDIVQAIALSAFFGHLNRIADAVGVPLDYEVRHLPAPPDPSIDALPPAPVARSGRPAIDLIRRPATAAALAEWKRFIFQRDAPLTRRQRTLLARWVAAWLGDGGISSPKELTANPLDDMLRTVAEIITLAPWKLDDHSFDVLAGSFGDAAVFDVCATASSQGVFSRIEVALISLAT